MRSIVACFRKLRVRYNRRIEHIVCTTSVARVRTIFPGPIDLSEDTITPTAFAFAISSKENEAPLCNCNEPACKRRVRKEGPNRGRLFWGCGQWSATDEWKGCGFFEWVPDEPKQKLEQKQVEQATTGHPIKLFTFNAARFKPHHFAPPEFDPQECLAEKIDQLKPDVITLQELPNPYFNHPGYYTVGTARSHCGYVALLVNNRLSFNEQEDTKDQENTPLMTPLSLSTSILPDDMMASESPFVIGLMELPNQRQFVVVSCHLEPYAVGSSIRLAQIKALTKSLPSNCVAILAGDMNARNKEDASIESLQWQDAWKQAGSVRCHEYTWNSMVNHYHGKDAYQFTSRFDRVYFKNVQCVESFKLVANGAMPNDDMDECYYLSDHFGILTTVLV